MEKQILLKIKVDSNQDEFGNLMKFKGFDENKPIQNSIEVIGLLEILKQQEIKRILNREVSE